jgi:hypothetical protein
LRLELESESALGFKRKFFVTVINSSTTFIRKLDRVTVDRKSDGSVVPAKSTNKGGPKAPAEWMEERDPVERNTEQADLSRTQRRNYGMSKWFASMRESILWGRLAFDSRQEPYEVIPHIRICAGGRRQRRFLPQSLDFNI